MRDLRHGGDLGQAGRSDRERERSCERLPDALAADGPGRPRPVGDGPAPGRARALRPSHRDRRHVGAGLGEPGEDPRKAGPFGGSRGLSLEGRGPEPGERRRVSSGGPEHPSFLRRCVGPPRALAAAGRNRGAEGCRHASGRGARPLRLSAPRGPFVDCGVADERGDPRPARPSRGGPGLFRTGGPARADGGPIPPSRRLGPAVQRPRDLRSRRQRPREWPCEWDPLGSDERPHEWPDKRPSQRPCGRPCERPDNRSRQRPHVRQGRDERPRQRKRIHERPPGSLRAPANSRAAALVSIGRRHCRRRSPHGHRPDPREHAFAVAQWPVLDHPDRRSLQHGVDSFRFNETGTPRSNDWRRFVSGGSADAAVSGQQLELRTTVADPAKTRILVYAADNLGDRDSADGSVVPSRPTVVLGQQTVAPDVVAGPGVAFLRVTMSPMGGVPHLAALNVTRLGTSTDAVDLSLYRDDGSGALDAADPFLSNVSMTGVAASLPMNEVVEAPEVLWIQARWANLTPTSTFGLSVAGIVSNGTASFRAPETGLVYLGAAPTNLRVDGAFGDWRGRPYGQDVLGDVTNRTGAPEYDANVDLVATAVDLGTNFTGYVRVDGRLLGGQDIPTTRSRTYPVAVDTDLDTVPDSVENLLGPNLTRDFNNDNITDDRTNGDVDGDGIPDYPAGPDCWLNTTIPSWYPPPYAGRSVTRYICPIGLPPEEGVDVVYAYIDADNSSATGLWSDVQGRIYGFDYTIAVIGRNGAVNSSGLYAFVPARANPWNFVRPIDVGLDAHRMEFSVNSSALALAAGYQVVYFASDWRLGYDVALPDAAVARFPIAAQAATNAVINEVSPQPNPEWVELANPTASAVPLNGWTLAVNRGNKAVVVYTFSGTIGAWGSGQEYLAAFLPANSLPNGQTQLLLMQGTTVIDATTYSSSSGSGRTWARFKDPVSGVPADTNNDAV